MGHEIVAETHTRIAKAIEKLHDDLVPIRSGRAHSGLVEHIRVDYYGTMTPLKQMANITAPEPRMIMIQAFDASATGSIERAINEASIGLQASKFGSNSVRVPVPELSQERRKEYVKLAKKLAEEARVSVRNVRRDANDKLKKAEKDKTLTEDDLKVALDSIQKETDQGIAEIDKLVAAKEKDLLTV